MVLETPTASGVGGLKDEFGNNSSLLLDGTETEPVEERK